MPRPFRKRMVRHSNELFYKPAGVRMANLQSVTLEADEYEALRLADLEKLSHEDAGKKMKVSRQTFGRIIEKAREKTADALINGKALSITAKGPVEMLKASLVCSGCGHAWRDTIAADNSCPQ